MTVEKAEVIHEPLPVPDIPEKLAQPPSQLTLSPEHQKMYDGVLAHFQSEEYALPKVEQGELREEEKFWLSCECMLRYLRATKWSSTKAAIKRLEETLVWRREYGVYDLITAEHVEPEAVTGKMFLFGYDVDGRPALYMRPSRQNTEESIVQMHYLTWIFERAIDLMGPGVENIALMVDFADKAKNPSLAQTRNTLNIMQNHYPERLGRAFITNVPFLVNAFFKVISPFIDPVSREKMHFNPQCVKEGLFTPDQLVSEWNGDCVFEYQHDRYWPVLIRMCTERREKMMATWRELGGEVGLKEWDVKCAIEVNTRPGDDMCKSAEREVEVEVEVEANVEVDVEAY
ncbi:CRAL/TRIO domain-containing protein [Laetiporus sulphureus 93-53]|uniref:CRAL/TRIO domain-containing protein n=1 Tax=Laetiporus sulphureus 93-53 TaxID=1314785 RepID=A0A165ETN8_9APHY|nr:CRAL/TRIO domain-containing protein [Laetiporus sulphureus 93-53]KZT07736.1 CRAL/TRIO domain-containing protein [Laetiporus sulphureus 93-53]